MLIPIRRNHNETKALQAARNAARDTYYAQFADAERASMSGAEEISAMPDQPLPVQPSQGPAVVVPVHDPGEPVQPAQPAPKELEEPAHEPPAKRDAPSKSEHPKQKADSAVSTAQLTAAAPVATPSQLRPEYREQRNHRR